MILGAIPSFDIVTGKTVNNFEWHQVVHPIMHNILGMFIKRIWKLTKTNNFCYLQLIVF